MIVNTDIKDIRVLVKTYKEAKTSREYRIKLQEKGFIGLFWRDIFRYDIKITVEKHWMSRIKGFKYTPITHITSYGVRHETWLPEEFDLQQRINSLISEYKHYML